MYLSCLVCTWKALFQRRKSKILSFLSLSKQRTMAALHKRQEKGSFFQAYNKEIFMHPAIQKYTERCCKYTWKLVCQTPPYLMEGNFSLVKNPGVAFNPAAHQHSRDFTPPQQTSECIDCVIWPGLFVNDGSSKRVIRKTEVILKWTTSDNSWSEVMLRTDKALAKWQRTN